VARRSGPDLDRLAELEAERSFLLDSLRDLEVEHAAGDVDEHDYVTLRDGYTKRAADVLRQIDAGKAKLAPKRPANWPRRIGVIAAVVAATVGAGWAVAAWSGQRTPGQEMTGRAVEERDDATALLAEARALFSGGVFSEALARYQRVLEIDPANVEARTYLGWLLVKTAEGSDDEATWQSALAAAEDAFGAAIERDDTYADPHCFLASAVVGSDPDRAREEAARCLALDPPADLADLASGVVAGLDAAPATTVQ
jgi:tetratricopeptide (TPR) repeat protein